VSISGSGIVIEQDGRAKILPTRDGSVRVRSVRPGSRGLVEVETIAREAILRSPGSADGRARLMLEMANVQRRDVVLTSSFEDAPVRESVPALGVRLEPSPLNDLLNIDALGLIEHARGPAQLAASADPLRRGFDALDEGVSQLLRDVTAKQHERWAFAVSCFIMTLTGAVMALRYAQRLPLTVYLWTFFPAIVCLVTISGGQQTARSNPMAGLALMWSGVVALGLYTFVSYRRLARH
jgi:hypothetical protein